MTNESVLNKSSSDFQNAWLSKSVTAPQVEAKKLSPVQKSLDEIKQYAYDAFDSLDSNKNGFIETEELYAAIESPDTPMREKSFITFLLNNQAEIAETCQEGQPEHKNGISRLDLELYFRLIISKVQQ